MKTVLITGGTRGIGLGVAHMLLEAGYKVAITGRLETSLSPVLPALQAKYPGKVLGMVADVRNYEEQAEAVKQIIETWGALDILVANAGVGYFADIEEMDIERWRETIDINLTGVFYSVKACLEALKRQKGYVITIASLAGANFFARGAAYNASKFGLVGFTQAIMLDLRKHGIKTTTIMPGSVSTEFNNHVPGPADVWKIQPEDIGQMILDLLNMPARTLPSKIEVRPSFPPTGS
jgi:3-oxoacyl-[acyl-carrier protein] reductase